MIAWYPITDINQLQRGDIIRNPNYDVYRVNGSFGDGVIIADIETNEIEVLTEFEGWKKREEMK